MYVLHDNDRVIHHQPDRDHHGEEGQQVDRKPHQVHEEEAADQRERNCSQGNEHYPQRAQKEVDDEDHDDRGFEHGLQDLEDCFIYIEGRVVIHEDFEIGRHLAAEIGQGSMHPACDFEGVGSGRGLDGNENRGLATGERRVLDVLVREFQVGDVFQDDAPVAFLAHNDCCELLGLREICLGFDAGQNPGALGRSTRRNIVVASQGIPNILSGYPVGGHFFGVQPHPHGEVLVAE